MRKNQEISKQIAGGKCPPQSGAERTAASDVVNPGFESSQIVSGKFATQNTDLSVLIRRLKGRRSTAEVVRGAGVSRETFRKIERGQTVKLDTLKAIADSLNVSNEAWRQLVIGWIKAEIGQHACGISFALTSEAHEASPRYLSPAESGLLQQLEHLNQDEKIEANKALQRKEVIAFLPAINELIDRTAGESSRANGTSWLSVPSGTIASDDLWARL